MTETTLTAQMAGMSPKQQRTFLKLQSRISPAASRESRAALSELQALRSLRDRLRVHYCSEPRLEVATDSRCQRLPGVVCGCESCTALKREWPEVYLMSVRDENGRRFEASYECFIESQSEAFLAALPSSSSIVRFG
jgi:hypothetical protein